ncbi:TPA: hypothetical protein HA238_01750 [Candidatus Micrarchaeota archaeon]|nr:hypothetical protein [Candidatus Micrarchaeota archaeon]
MGKTKLILGLIILLAGLGFAGAPAMVSTYLNVTADPLMIRGLGVVLVIIGLIVLVKGRK